MGKMSRLDIDLKNDTRSLYATNLRAVNLVLTNFIEIHGSIANELICAFLRVLTENNFEIVDRSVPTGPDKEQSEIEEFLRVEKIIHGEPPTVSVKEE